METRKITLAELGTNHVWFSGVGAPAGCDWVAEEGEQLSLPDSFLDCAGIVVDGRWEWDGEGNPRDFKGNTVQKIVAFCGVERRGAAR